MMGECWRQKTFKVVLQVMNDNAKHINAFLLECFYIFIKKVTE